MFEGCRGAERLKTPTIEEKTCPRCGNEVELFSVDAEAKCDRCGFTIYNDVQSCAKWCRHARLCLGGELYEKLSKANGREDKKAAEPFSQT